MDGWKSKSGNCINKYTEMKDGIAFATDEKKKKQAIVKTRKKK
jgi:hypothetical protein